MNEKKQFLYSPSLRVREYSIARERGQHYKIKTEMLSLLLQSAYYSSS